MLSTILKYPVLAILSIGKKNFRNMGRTIGKSGDTVLRCLCESTISIEQAQNISFLMFKNKKRLFCIIDDTLIKKIYSKLMQGSGKFYDTAISRRITAYRLVVSMISDGKLAIPIDYAYLFSKELLERMDEQFPSKDDWAKKFVLVAKSLFPNADIIVLADGLYSTVKFLTWCKENKISSEMRMHSNRKVIYHGRKISLKELSQLPWITLRGRRMCRTVTAIWHDLEVEITIVRRLDKHGEESIVFQVATYKARPSLHAAHYKIRWNIEKFNRTAKQELGLEDCFSTDFDRQHRHVAAILLAYALSQWEMKRAKLKTPEEAIRQLKTKNYIQTIHQFARLERSLDVYA